MCIPLNQIELTGQNTLTLSLENLGDIAYVAVDDALKQGTDATLINCKLIPPQTANLLIVEGELSNFLGQGNVDLRLYLFEVPTITDFTERHAILLFTKLPANFTPATLIANFCQDEKNPVEKTAIETLIFATGAPYLLFSSLDYRSSAYETSAYKNPPFPPETDPKAPQDFIAKIKPDLTQGYVFSASAQLSDTSAAGNSTLSAALELLNLDTTLCQGQFSVNGTLASSSDEATLELLHQLNKCSASKIPFKPSLTQVGIGLTLGSGTTQIPFLELDGTVTLAQSPSKPPSKPPSKVQMSFAPSLGILSINFLELPPFGDLASHFSSNPDDSLTKILNDFLPQEVINDLGSFEILQLGASIDCYKAHVDTLFFSVTTEHPLSLFDGIELQPALIVNFTDPFDSKTRSYDVEVVGKWFLKDSELDTILFIDRSDPSSPQTQLLANLSIGSGINFVNLAEQLFHAEVAGLPSLVLSDVEIAAQRIGTGDNASESVSLELDVAAGWTLDGIDIDLDDLSLNITFDKENAKANWAVTEASAQGTLEIGSAFFYLDAEYDGSDKTWTFSGGTLPGETENLGDFLTAVIKDLGLSVSPSFLVPFNACDVTGCYLEYQTSSTSSSNWQLTVSTNFESGNQFNEITLDKIVLSLNRDGTGTSFSLDATTPDTSSQGAGTVVNYLNSNYLKGNAIALPASLTDDSIVLKGLSASHNADTNSYHFVAYLNFGNPKSTGGSKAFIQLHIDLVSQAIPKDKSATTPTYDYDLGGTLIFNPDSDTDRFDFKLDLVKSDGVSDLVASLRADSSKKITLDKLIEAIAPSTANADLGSFSIDIKDALFAHTGKSKAGQAKSLFAVDMGAAVNLSSLKGLPVIGHELASVSSLDLAFQVVYATGSYTTDEIQSINQALGDPSFRFPDNPAAGEISLATSMRVGDKQLISITIPVKPGNNGNLTPETNPSLAPTESLIITSQDAAQQTGGSQPITWHPLNESFGPMHINRVGFAFDKTNVAVLGYLDGDISVGPLLFDLLGLDVSIPLQGKSKFDPSFGLQGLGLSVQRDPVDISGALVKQDASGKTSFDGFVTIQTESFQIGAVGSFAEMQDGQNSLFVYAVSEDPLGGPVFFDVTGFAVGFGYNRKLLPPAISEVQNFPLVSEAMAPSPQPQIGGDISGVPDYISQKLALMQKSIVPTAGEYFLAAGVKFTSFELINGFLLAIVQFGNESRIDLLGLAQAAFPPDESSDVLAEVQLAVLAHYIPSEGSVLVQGQLTPNSYILSHNCHLTGGFALACWVSGPHSGEFVVSIGGYGPNYSPPEYYPTPPPVGFNWHVSSQLNLKGDGYFALLPHAMMAGGALNAVWNGSLVKAWFLMNVDFLLGWKPFHYAADIQVELGADLTIHAFGTHHIHIDASAALSVWGPEFGGHAQLSVDVIGVHVHFNIDFGESSTTPPPLVWNQFEASFLPQEQTQWLGISLQGGLMRTVKGPLPNGGKEEVDIWIVKRDELQLSTSSVLPVKSVMFKLNGQSIPQPNIDTTNLGIKPMSVNAIQESQHSISIQKISSSEANTAKITEQLKLEKNSRNVPSALWGQSESSSPRGARSFAAINSTSEVLESISGFSIKPSQEAQDDSSPLLIDASVLDSPSQTEPGYTWEPDTGGFAPSTASWSEISNAISATASVRSLALNKMGFANYKENFNQKFDALTAPQLGTWKP